MAFNIEDFIDDKISIPVFKAWFVSCYFSKRWQKMVETLDRKLASAPKIAFSRHIPRHPGYVGRLNKVVNELMWTGLYFMKGSAAYNDLLDRWTDIVARKKMENPPTREESRKLEAAYMARIYDTNEERERAFMKLKYGLGDVTRAEIRQALAQKLDAYLARKAVLLHSYLATHN